MRIDGSPAIPWIRAKRKTNPKLNYNRLPEHEPRVRLVSNGMGTEDFYETLDGTECNPKSLTTMAPVHSKTALLVFIIGLAAFILVFLALFLVLYRSGTPEPDYAGKSLTEWVENFSPDAIRAIGTNGLPTLLNLIRRKDSSFQKRLISLSEKPALSRFRRYRVFRMYSAEFYHQNAGAAFMMLGPVAKDAVPELVELLNHKDYSIRKHAMRAMSGIGTERVILPYTRALTKR